MFCLRFGHHGSLELDQFIMWRALIGTRCKLAAYNYISSLTLWTTLEYELVDANGVCQGIQKVRLEPATRSAVATLSGSTFLESDCVSEGIFWGSGCVWEGRGSSGAWERVLTHFQWKIYSRLDMYSWYLYDCNWHAHTSKVPYLLLVSILSDVGSQIGWLWPTTKLLAVDFLYQDCYEQLEATQCEWPWPAHVLPSGVEHRSPCEGCPSLPSESIVHSRKSHCTMG